MIRRCLVVVLALCALWGCTNTGVICDPGEVRCGQTCANLQIDPDHCSACGVACPVNFSCQNAQCVCTGGLTACAQSCVDLTTNHDDCGACGHPCGANQVCQASACVSSCGNGAVTCGGSCVDTQSDRLNCGACGTACAQGLACIAGVCQSDLYAACTSAGAVYGLDATAEVAQATPLTSPLVSPAGLAFYGPSQLEVADYGADELFSFPLTNGTFGAPSTDSIGAASGAYSVAIDGTHALVLRGGDSSLDVLDLTQPAGARRICPGGGSACTATVAFAANSDPQYAAVTSDDIFVSLLGQTQDPTGASGNQVARVHKADWSVHLTNIPTAPLQAQSTFPRPQGVVVDAATQSLYVALANLDGFTPDGPGLLAQYALPGAPLATGFDADGGDDLTLLGVHDLGQGCINAGATLEVGGVIYVACGPRYDPTTFAVTQAGALAAFDTDAGAAAFPPITFGCTGTSGCTAGGTSRLAAAAGKLFVGDSDTGRLFVVNLATQTLERGPDNALNLCIPDGGFESIGDVVALPLP